MKIPKVMLLILVSLVLGGCSSVDARIASYAIPVDEAQAFANRVAAAFPLADLDGDGQVPTSLDELIALFRAVRED